MHVFGVGMVMCAQHTIGHMTWMAVAIGGALGSVARHGVNHLVHVRWLTTRFPLATMAVNLIGCLVIGLLAGLLASERIGLRPHWREFVFVGVLGGFTTFSTFGLDTFLLARTHSVGQAAINIAAQVAGGLMAVWCGYYLGVKA
jgi:fluoride exporter